MSIVEKGKSNMAARARLMLLLGEQLITDEVAAVSELVKNSYDADASQVNVTISNVSNPEIGFIVIEDNGHGMTKENLLSSWLELGTMSKARGADLKPRFTESGKRQNLGEKGLGRLAVHKLGLITELVTKRANSDYETKLTIDWTLFDQTEAFLEEIPIGWEVSKPKVFSGKDTKGTRITVRNLQRQWNSKMIEQLQRSMGALKSPFVDLSDFEIKLTIDDPKRKAVNIADITDIVKKATYQFTADIDSQGIIDYKYRFQRPDLPDLSRKKTMKKDIRDPKIFTGDKKPICGPFSLRFYCWDLSPKDVRVVFGDTKIHKELVRPNTGVKVFRDGFRVLPYGNVDNDWLSLDLARVRRFERHISRNMIIAAIEISGENNPLLLDKTDREGLIDNDAFRDFFSLVKSAITEFEAERHIDRSNLKIVTGRTRDELSSRAKYLKNLVALSRIIANQGIDAETKLKIDNLLKEAREVFDDILQDKEQPLLAAASIGLTYTMPTHEIRRDLHESQKILLQMKKLKKFDDNKIDTVIELLKQVRSILLGIGRLMQKSRYDENFKLERVVNNAIRLMKHRFERSNIILKSDSRENVEVKGSDRLATILLINLLDNSFYWLLRKRKEERKVTIIFGSYEDKGLILVTDSGPGFEDDLESMTMPFFTRKPNGMGLGLYIADRIAKLFGGKLKVFEKDEMEGLLPGASIGVLLTKKKK